MFRSQSFAHSLTLRFALANLSAVLVVIVCLLTYTTSVSAHDDDPSKHDVFIIYQANGSETVCREATLDEKLELAQIKPKGLRQINHFELQKSPGSGPLQSTPHLTIILRASANLNAAPQAKAAFIRAAATWEGLINSPITIFIDADYGPDNFGTPWTSGVLGSTASPSQSNVPYSSLRNILIAGANSPQKTVTYNSLPQTSIPTDLGSASAVSVSNSIARAIGLLPETAADTDSAPRMGFNSTFNFDFDASDGITSGQFDFEAVVTHEIGHALGFTSRAGNGGTTPAMWDFYRFRTGTTNGTFSTALRVMTIGGPIGGDLQFYFVPDSNELGLSTGGPSAVSTGGGDGNQSSHWKQASLNGGVLSGYIGIIDPRIPSGLHRAVTPNDTNTLNILGYNSTPQPQPSPPPNDNFSAALVLTGCSGSVNGTNLGATKEAGEPNHSPDDGGGNRSVWYQWQSPSTGNVTVNTVGSDFDTVMGVYTGNSVNALTPLGKSDDANPDHTSSVTFSATAGTIYRIAVDGYNNSNSGGDIGSIMLSWTASNCTNSTPSIQFDSPTVNAAESIGSMNVIVTRTGDTSGVSSVDYATSDTSGKNACSVVSGLASAHCDYVQTLGTLQFAAGETQKVIQVPLVNDSFTEGSETFTMTLSNPSGATLGTSTATLTILDIIRPPVPNPIDVENVFVRQHYIDFLNREPDQDGFNFWVGQLLSCGADPQCIELKRINVSGAFFLSIEFQETGYLVYRVYKSAFGNLTNPPGAPVPIVLSDFLRDTQRIGQGVQVNVGNWQAILEANKQAYMLAFVQRPDFVSAFPNGMSPTDFVTQLSNRAGGPGVISPAEQASLINIFAGSTADVNKRAQVLRAVAEDQTLKDAEFNKAFVLMQYFGYLRRNPNEGNDTNFDGYNFWLAKLNQFNGNFINAEMVKSFLISAEYRQRFGP